MKLFGIDPGLTATGYGVISISGNRLTPLSWGVIRSKGDDLSERLGYIFRELSVQLQKHSPDVVAVEDIFMGRNPRAALLIGHARGVALLAASLGGYPVREYPTAVIKQSVTGGGRAAKKQVQFMIDRLLGLEGKKVATDAADALAAAICCAIKGDYKFDNEEAHK